MIRASLSVMPRRGVSLAAKAVVFGAIALIVGLVTSFASYFVGQAILSSQHINSTIGQPGVLRAVIGGGLFLAVCGLLSFGLGAVLRHTAGAITASIGVLFVLFVLSGFLPSNWAVHIDKWIPFNAGGAIWENQSGTSMFSPWTGRPVSRKESASFRRLLRCSWQALNFISGVVESSAVMAGVWADDATGP